MGNCKEGAAVKIGRETGGTPSDRNVERPNVTSRVTEHLFIAACDKKGVDACNHHEFVAPFDNLVALHDNTGTDTDVLMRSSLSLHVTTSVTPTATTTSVRPTPGGFFFCIFCQGVLLPLQQPCDSV